MANINNNDFFAQLIESSSKTRYQEFIAEMGIEKVKVLIPVSKAKDFEKEALTEAPSFIKELKAIVQKYDGILSEEAI
jgi:nitrogenase molybdenum-iron protein alpha/beta subunit